MNRFGPFTTRFFSAFLLALAFTLPSLANAQINFIKTDYYVAIGDSISAGEGALPVTNGFAYQLYDHNTFAKKRRTDFSNISIRAARTWEVLEHQVPQAICITGFQPNIVTITVGANDFFGGDQDLYAIAARAAEIANRLLNGAVYFDAQKQQFVDCPRLPNVTVLIANNYTLPHPNPTYNAIFDTIASAYADLLNLLVGTIHVPDGSQLALIDLYSAFKNRHGLLLIEKKNGITGPDLLDVEVHPTNAGHRAIAREFRKAWDALQD